jgi:hypothetical protein
MNFEEFITEINGKSNRKQILEFLKDGTHTETNIALTAEILTLNSTFETFLVDDTKRKIEREDIESRLKELKKVLIRHNAHKTYDIVEVIEYRLSENEFPSGQILVYLNKVYKTYNY